MKKEQYKNFEKNLLIYRTAESPKFHFDELSAKNLTISGELPTKLSSKQFEDSKTEAEERMKKIDLDANPDIQTFAEKKLLKDLETRNSEQFDNLETEYGKAVRKLGSRSERLTEVRDILENEIDLYLDNLDRHVIHLSLTEGTAEAQGAVIDRFISEYGENYDGLEGLGKYIILGSPSKLAAFQRKVAGSKSQEEFNKAFEDFINTDCLTDSAVLENAIKKMAEDLPQFKRTPAELSYFEAQFKNSDGKNAEDWLGYTFGEGKENVKNAQKFLALRFHVEFKKDKPNEAEYIYDLMTNELHQPGEAWNKKLKEICHEELSGDNGIEGQQEELNKIKEERDDKVNELLNGNWKAGDNEATGMSGLKNNHTLSEMLGLTKEHLDTINKGINPQLQEIKSLAGEITDEKTAEVMARLDSALNPKTIRNSGLLAHLAEIIKAIQTAVKNNDHEALSVIDSGIRSGKNPTEVTGALEKRKEAVKQNYETLLTNNPQPLLSELFELYNNETKRDKFFTDRAKGNANAEKMITMYPELRQETITKHLEGKLDVENLVIRAEGVTTNLTFRSKITKKIDIYRIAKQADGKIKVQTPDGKEAEPVEFTLAGLKGVIDGYEKAGKENLEREKAELTLILIGLVKTEKLTDKSPLEQLVDKFIEEKDKPKLDESEKEHSDDEKQTALDGKRAELLIQKCNDPAFLKKLKADTIIQQAFTAKKVEEAKAAEGKEETEFKTKITLYIKTLEDMIQLGDPKQKTSPLGEIINLTNISEANRPSWKQFSKITNKAARQKALDKARFTVITDYMKSLGTEAKDIKPFIDKLASYPTFAAALGKAKAASS